MPDSFDLLYADLRRMLAAGVDRISLGPVTVGDLLDTVDHYYGITDHALAYAGMTVARHLGERAAQERFFRETLGATEVAEGRFELATPAYTAVWLWDQGAWWWETRKAGD